jgi:hypothetical protein
MEYGDAARSMHDAVKRVGNKIAYLSGDNTYRLPSVDGALCKGGSEIFFPERGLSPFIRRLFPGRWCGQVPSKVYLAEFEGIVLLRLKEETLESAISRIERAFQSTMEDFVCAEEFPARGSAFVVCERLVSPDDMRPRGTLKDNS